jgi:hypothetical protein
MSKESIGWCGSPAGHGSSRRRGPVAGNAKVGRSHTSIAVFIELCQCDNLAPVTVPDDPSMETLLDLDGQVLVVDPDGGHWVRFVVTRVPVSAEKPHGLDYSLTSAPTSDDYGLRIPRCCRPTRGFLENG